MSTFVSFLEVRLTSHSNLFLKSSTQFTAFLTAFLIFIVQCLTPNSIIFRTQGLGNLLPKGLNYGTFRFCSTDHQNQVPLQDLLMRNLCLLFKFSLTFWENLSNEFSLCNSLVISHVRLISQALIFSKSDILPFLKIIF